MISMRNNSESYLFSCTYDYNNKGKIVKITEKEKNKAKNLKECRSQMLTSAFSDDDYKSSAS